MKIVVFFVIVQMDNKQKIPILPRNLRNSKRRGGCLASESSVVHIMDEMFRDVTRRLAGLETRPAECGPAGREVLSLLAEASGDYSLKFSLCAEKSFLMDVARRMKRVPPITDEEEAAGFLREYFNVLCGRVVSAINNQNRCAARIGMTSLVAGPCPVDGGGMLCERRYESVCGRAAFRGLYCAANARK